jgi:hypothetical protein
VDNLVAHEGASPDAVARHLSRIADVLQPAKLLLFPSFERRLAELEQAPRIAADIKACRSITYSQFIEIGPIGPILSSAATEKATENRSAQPNDV